MLPRTPIERDLPSDNEGGSKKLARLARNLGETIELLGENCEAIARDGQKWFSRVESEFRANRDKFPSRTTLENWCEANVDTYNPHRLLVLCAYLRYGRYELPLPSNFVDICTTMARRMVHAPTPWHFRKDYALPRSRKPNRFVRRNLEVPDVPEEQISQLIKTAILAIKAAQHEIKRKLDLLRRSPIKVGLEFQSFPSGQRQSTTDFDGWVEGIARQIFIDRYGDEIHFEGEESLKRYAGNFPGWNRRVCALADMVDGTDHAAMDVNLWCSAIVIYDNAKSRILASLVGFSSGRICIARDDRKDAWFANEESEVFPSADNTLAGPSDLEDVTASRIGFYGQKPENFLMVASDTAFINLISRVQIESAGESALRLFNFAGNQMIVKLVDRSRSNDKTIADGIDAVFEKKGQRPHDFVPAAYIALRMEAAMFDLDEMSISEDDLADMVRTPDERARPYVIAGTENLAVFLAQNLSSDPAPILKT
jgi:hypothetical protein